MSATQRTTLGVVLALASPAAGAPALQDPARPAGAEAGPLILRYPEGAPGYTQVVSAAFSEEARRSLRGQGTGKPPAQPSGTYSINYAPEPPTLNNITRTTGRAEVICVNYLFPPLLDITGDLELVPELAESMPEVLDEGRRLRWKLREGVLWHRGHADGSPAEVTTADVLYSWNMIRDPRVEAQPVAAALNRFQELNVLGPYTFEVTLEKPYFREVLEFGWQFRLMPAHLSPTDPEAFNKDPLGRDPVGYGPYRVEEWRHGESLTLVRNPGYWDRERRPFHMERLKFVFVTDPKNVVGLFRRGDLSVCVVDDPEEWDRIKEDEFLQQAATFHEYHVFRFNYIVWNNDFWAFQDPRVRRAMTLLCNRQVIRDRFYRGHADLVSGPFPLISREYNHEIAPFPFDPEQARALLEEAGFRDSDGDGVLDRDGRPLEFRLLAEASGALAMEKGALLFQQDLRNAGVLMHLEKIEFAGMVKKLQDREFEAAQLGWRSDPRDEDLYPLLHSSQAQPGAHNYAGYRSAACDQLLDEYRDELDEGRRLELAGRIHALVHEDQPFTFLPSPRTLLLVTSRLQNVAISRRGALFDTWFFADR